MPILKTDWLIVEKELIEKLKIKRSELKELEDELRENPNEYSKKL